MHLSVTSRWSLAALALAGMGLAAVPGHAAGPPKGWAAPVLVSKTQAARETSFATDPRNLKNQFVCDPSGVPDTGDGQSYFHTSHDGGATWKFQSVETAQTDTRKAAFEGGDCDVAFDAAGTMYSADTWLGDLSIGHSQDGGKSWDGTAVSTTSPIVDRPWLVGGKAGEVFVSYHDLQCCMPSAMWFFRSTDYGKTFTRPVLVANAGADGAFIWEGNFVVSPSGKDVSLIYTHRNSGAVDPGVAIGAPMSVWLATSHDAGDTWTNTKITDLTAETSTIYPAIGLDKGGGLHATWAMPREGDSPVFYTYSADGGHTWTAAKALNTGHTGWAPWIVGGPTKGSAALVWLGSPSAKASSSTVQSWFFSWARVTVAGGKVTAKTGNTTAEPVYVGQQVEPEFEMVRLDDKGLMHMGMSVYQGSAKSGKWSVWVQRETSAGH